MRGFIWGSVSVFVLCHAPFGAPAARAGMASFEEFAGPPYSLGAQSYYNGADGAGGFDSGGVRFRNNYDQQYAFWSGFAASNVVDTTTPGFLNQYAAWPGSGAGGSAFYAVGYFSPFAESPLPSIQLPAGAQPQSVQITNTTYTALALRDGEYSATPFGGPDGNSPDWFRLTITGLDANGVPLDAAVHFFLADYRFEDSAQDYIVNAWTTVNLAPLAGARTLQFSLASSDVGPYGINTPTYFALDDLVFTPEPSAFLALSLIALLRPRMRRA
jgi:hypothetical protein